VSNYDDMPGAPAGELPVAVLVDATALRCPLPLLRLRQALRDVAVGEYVLLQATDAGSVKDIAAYSRLSGNTLDAFSAEAETFHYWVKRTS